MSCLDAQTQLATAGLTSEAERAFVDRLPSIDTLMPRLSFAEIVGEAEPPIAEQLVCPNTLRQRRFRERFRLISLRPTAAIDSPSRCTASTEGGSYERVTHK
jgi:hypothetical protein